MAGRSGIGGRARRRNGLRNIFIDAGPGRSPRGPMWRELLASLTACDEVTPLFAEPDPGILWRERR